VPGLGRLVIPDASKLPKPCLHLLDRFSTSLVVVASRLVEDHLRDEERNGPRQVLEECSELNAA
jgi:hypothetical protein